MSERTQDASALNGADCAGADYAGAAQLICPECMNRLSFVKPPVCEKCGKQVLVASQRLCTDCTEHPRSYERGVCLLNYEEHARESMVRIKYKRRGEYMRFYGRMMARRLEGAIREMNPQCIIPVPVHPERYLERGYNQAVLLADELGRALSIPVRKDILVRIRNTTVQKDLGPEERLKNLSEAFGVLYDDTGAAAAGFSSDTAPAGRVIPYDRVLLVDDIYTTGSTIEACTRVLMTAGVRQVYFAAICTGSDR